MWKMVKKLKNIIIGWYRYLFKPMPKFAKNRYAICKRCSHNIKECGLETCNICFCVIKAKVMVEDEQCYDGRW